VKLVTAGADDAVTASAVGLAPFVAAASLALEGVS
jgi:hypothetical protein